MDTPKKTSNPMETLKSRCGAKTRSGGTCLKSPMSNGKCRTHGGATPIGIAHPNYKLGRYSKGLSSLLGTRFADALSDSKLGELSAEIALVGAHIEDRIEKLHEHLRRSRSSVTN